MAYSFLVFPPRGNARRHQPIVAAAPASAQEFYADPEPGVCVSANCWNQTIFPIRDRRLRTFG